MKMELLQLKMKQEHEFRMAQLQGQQGQAGPSSFFGSSSHHGSPFPATQSLLEDLHEEFPTLPPSDRDYLGTSSYGSFGGFSK